MERERERERELEMEREKEREREGGRSWSHALTSDRTHTYHNAVPVHPSTHPSIHPPIHPLIYPPIHPSTHPSIHLQCICALVKQPRAVSGARVISSSSMPTPRSGR